MSLFVLISLLTGAVIVTANQNDIASLEKALDGADAMFLTTHYWEEKNKEKEIVRVSAVNTKSQARLSPAKLGFYSVDNKRGVPIDVMCVVH